MGGSNFGRQSRNAVKRDTIKAVKAFEESIKWIPESKLEVDPGIWLHLTEETRIRFRVSRSNNPQRIADFALMHQKKYQGTWALVVRIDCAHSEVHRHGAEFTSSGTLKRTVIRNISSQKDVEETYYEQIEEIQASFIESESKWDDSVRIHRVSSTQIFSEIDEDNFYEPLA